MGVQIVALNSQTVDCPFNLLLKVFFQEYSPKMIGYFPKVNLDDNARITDAQKNSQFLDKKSYTNIV